MRDLKDRIKVELKLLTRKLPILEWRKSRKKKGEKFDEREQKFADSIAVHRANIRTLQEEFKLVQMNKTESQYFQWISNKGMNRSQAKAFRRQNRKRKPTNRVVA